MLMKKGYVQMNAPIIKKFTHNEKDTQHKQMKREKNEC